MSDLSPEARALLDAARGSDEPGPADRQRVRAAVFGAVGLPHAGPGVSSSAAQAAQLAPTTGAQTSALVLKLLLGAALVAAVAAGVFLALRDEPAPPNAELAHAPAVPVETPTPPTAPTIGGDDPASASGDSQPGAAAGEPAVEHGAATAAEVEAETDDRPAPPVRRRAPSKRPRAEPAPVATSVDELRAESALLGRARAALSAGDPDTALQLAAEHAERFPRGMMIPERVATRIFALCQLGKTAVARRETARFLDRWPRAPQAERVRRACGASQ